MTGFGMVSLLIDKMKSKNYEKVIISFCSIRLCFFVCNAQKLENTQWTLSMGKDNALFVFIKDTMYVYANSNKIATTASTVKVNKNEVTSRDIQGENICKLGECIYTYQIKDNILTHKLKEDPSTMRTEDFKSTILKGKS
jgi:hypothetical protein